MQALGGQSVGLIPNARKSYSNATEIVAVLKKLVRPSQPSHAVNSSRVRRRSAALEIPAATATHCSHPVRTVSAKTHEARGLSSIRFPCRGPSVLAFQTVEYGFLHFRRKIRPGCRGSVPCVIRIIGSQRDA